MEIIEQIGNLFIEYLPIIISIIAIVISIPIILFIRKRIKNRSRTSKLLSKNVNVGKFSVIMYRKIAGSYYEIERKKIDIKSDKFRYNNKTFVTFDIGKPLHSDKRANYYAFDYDTGERLTFDTVGMPKNISLEDIDTYVHRGIVAQLVQGLEDLKPKGQYIMLIIGLAVGIGLGIAIGVNI